MASIHADRLWCAGHRAWPLVSARPAVLFLVILNACGNGETPSMSVPFSHPYLATSRSATEGTRVFTSIDFPGAVHTVGRDITSTVDRYVGEYDDRAGHHGFVLQNGIFTSIDTPGGPSTDAHGINSRGAIVGTYRTPVEHGFLLHRDEFSPIEFPNALATSVQGINKRGDMVGGYCDRLPCFVEGNRGFELSSDGEYSFIDFPGASVTQPWKINSKRDVGGFYLDSVGHFHGFLLSAGRFRTIDVPGAVMTWVFGLNDHSDMVGSYCVALPCGIALVNQHAYRLSDGVFTSFDFPGAVGTRAFAINSRGDVAGAYLDKQSRRHAFLLSTGEDDDANSEQW